MTKPATTGNDEPSSTGACSDRSDVLVDHQAVEVELHPDGVRFAGVSRTGPGSPFGVAAALTMAVVGAGVAAVAVAFVGEFVGISPLFSFTLAFLAGVGVLVAYLLRTRPPRTATLVNRETGESEGVVPVRARPRLRRTRTKRGKRFTRG